MFPTHRPALVRIRQLEAEADVHGLPPPDLVASHQVVALLSLGLLALSFMVPFEVLLSQSLLQVPPNDAREVVANPYSQRKVLHFCLVLFSCFFSLRRPT